MKRFRVISCVVCFLLAAVLLTPCALAGTCIFKCPSTGKSLSCSNSKCGKQTVTVLCAHCNKMHQFTGTFSCSWVETARREPTTEAEGQITYTCSSCGKTKTETIPKLEPVNPDECTHDWQETGRTEPTTEAPGAVTYQCFICGKSRSEVLPKLEPEECTHDWKETDRTSPTETTPGQIIYTCSKCGEVKTEAIPVRPQYNGTFMNWLGSVVGLFNMTLNSIIGFDALRLHVGVLVFLAMFSLLAKLIWQGRKGRL